MGFHQSIFMITHLTIHKRKATFSQPTLFQMLLWASAIGRRMVDAGTLVLERAIVTLLPLPLDSEVMAFFQWAKADKSLAKASQYGLMIVQ